LLLGDVIDRGLDTFNVMRQLKAYWAAYPGKITLLHGNHEMLASQAFLGNRDAFQNWIHVGGREALESYHLAFPEKNLDQVIKMFGDDLLWYSTHAKHFVLRDGILYSHAAPPSPNSLQYMLEHPTQPPHNSDHLWDRPWASNHRSPSSWGVPEEAEYSIHGHTPQPRPDYYLDHNGRYQWVIDTKKHNWAFDTRAYPDGDFLYELDSEKGEYLVSQPAKSFTELRANQPGTFL
jgi:hypothetical protein